MRRLTRSWVSRDSSPAGTGVGGGAGRTTAGPAARGRRASEAVQRPAGARLPPEEPGVASRSASKAAFWLDRTPSAAVRAWTCAAYEWMLSTC